MQRWIGLSLLILYSLSALEHMPFVIRICNFSHWVFRVLMLTWPCGMFPSVECGQKGPKSILSGLLSWESQDNTSGYLGRQRRTTPWGVSSVQDGQIILANSWLILDVSCYSLAELHCGSMKFWRQKVWGLYPHEKGELFPRACQCDFLRCDLTCGQSLSS